jgi:hypothetical protein
MVDFFLFVYPAMLLPDALAMMIFGMALFKLDAFHLSWSTRAYVTLAGTGFGVGLITNLWELQLALSTDQLSDAVTDLRSDLHRLGIRSRRNLRALAAISAGRRHLGLPALVQFLVAFALSIWPDRVAVANAHIWPSTVNRPENMRPGYSHWDNPLNHTAFQKTNATLDAYFRFRFADS